MLFDMLLSKTKRNAQHNYNEQKIDLELVLHLCPSVVASNHVDLFIFHWLISNSNNSVEKEEDDEYRIASYSTIEMFERSFASVFILVWPAHSLRLVVVVFFELGGEIEEWIDLFFFLSMKIFSQKVSTHSFAHQTYFTQSFLTVDYEQSETKALSLSLVTGFIPSASLRDEYQRDKWNWDSFADMFNQSVGYLSVDDWSRSPLWSPLFRPEWRREQNCWINTRDSETEDLTTIRQTYHSHSSLIDRNRKKKNKNKNNRNYIWCLIQTDYWKRRMRQRDEKSLFTRASPRFS